MVIIMRLSRVMSLVDKLMRRIMAALDHSNSVIYYNHKETQLATKYIIVTIYSNLHSSDLLQ